MKIASCTFLATCIGLLFIEPSAADTPWRVHLRADGCQQPDPNKGVDGCTSDAFVHDQTGGKLYHCLGSVALPRIGVNCQVVNPPVSGNSSLTVPHVVSWHLGQTYNSPGGPAITHPYRSYYWIIGSTIESLRICHFPNPTEQVCSGPPSIRN